MSKGIIMGLRHIVLLGAPGSGKGTQAKRLKEDLELDHISVGDILRDEMHNKTEIGLRIADSMNKGELISDETIRTVMDKRLSDTDNFLLDGFPRTLAQANMLEEILSKSGNKLDAVVYLDVSRDEVVRRISGRRICRDCGSLFHVDYSPAKVEGVCDNCNGELYVRDDDTVETANKRMDVYLAATAPLIDFYREKGSLVDIDGNGDIDDIYVRIKGAIES